MGMELISNYAQGATLSARQNSSTFLNKVERRYSDSSYGLYHIAYLVPINKTA